MRPPFAQMEVGQDHKRRSCRGQLRSDLVEARRVGGDLRGQLDFDNGGVAVACINGEVGNVGAAATQLQSHRLMPDVDDERGTKPT